MEACRDYNKLCYWIHLLLLDEARLTKKIYQHSKNVYQKTNRNNWTKTIHELTKKYELSQLWEDEKEIFHVSGTCDVKSLKKHWLHEIEMKVHRLESRKWKEE